MAMLDPQDKAFVDNPWKSGRVTVEWPITVHGWCRGRAAGVPRVHDDPDKIPGDYNCCASIIVRDERYEVMGFTAKGAPPTKAEFKAFYDYLHSLGLQKHRHVRAKGGRVHVIQPAVLSPPPPKG